MRPSFAGLLLVCLAGCAAPTADPPAACTAKSTLGVLVLHGKLGRPDGYVAPLARALEAEGFLVNAAEMSWSGRRRFDRTVDEAMTEIDDAVAKLRAGGAKRVVVVGHSLGGAAALRYGTARRDLAALVLIAPGFNPETPFFESLVASAVAKARAEIESGKGDESDTYLDLGDDNRTAALVTRARTYFDWYNPASTIPVSRTAPKVAEGPAVFWITATGDPQFMRANAPGFFARLPMNSLNRYLVLESSHAAAPSAAVNHVKAFLQHFCS